MIGRLGALPYRSSQLPCRFLAIGAATLLIGQGCGAANRLQGQIDGLNAVAAQAAANGAKRCAPRELALAESHLKFAEVELAQGFPSKAETHLLIAEPNAQAALQLSPPDRCLDKPGDRDGDGYIDTEDKCPEEPEIFNGIEDADGCPEDPDTDRDGLRDSTDSCVLEPEDKDGYLDDDGCPELDNDSDGLADTVDQCPDDPEDPDGYEDEDGCPDPDNDRDTVPDLRDQCPNEIGVTDKDPLGCPLKPALVLVTDCEVKITEQIHFEYNKAQVRQQSFAVLDGVVEVLQRNPDIKMEVQGHTDNRGGEEYNLKLSERRAASVLDYIVSRGIDSVRLTSHGYGFERPLVPNSSAQNRALNRRVQFVRTEGTKAGCTK